VSAILVCPLARLAATVEEWRARHVVTLLHHENLVARPPRVAPADHLVVPIHDICEPMEGLVCPAAEHVGALLDFVAGWDRGSPLVVHCYAGISRSTAAAFAAFCALRPEADEAEIAQRLRARSPAATPNPRFVALADEVLGRGGRMVRAVERIGRGAEASEGSVFALGLDE
jgi:predicted protein tyrosine phosphatase